MILGAKSRRHPRLLAKLSTSTSTPRSGGQICLSLESERHSQRYNRSLDREVESQMDVEVLRCDAYCWQAGGCTKAGMIRNCTVQSGN